MTMAQKFDIAVSFADEQRAYVERTVVAAKALGLEVFYDKDVGVDWWGNDFVVEQRKIYGEAALFVVPFISKDYLRRPFPMDEFSAAMVKAVGRRHPYILPVLVGEVIVPPELLSPHVHFLRAEDYGPEQLAEQMRLKVEQAKRGGRKAEDLGVVMDDILQLPKVVPATFNKHRELVAVLEYFGEMLEAGGQRLGTLGFVSTVTREEDYVLLNVGREGRTEYALRISIGGRGMGQDKLTFSEGVTPNGMSAWAEPFYDLRARQARLRLVDFSLLGRWGGLEDRLAKEELFSKLWAKLVNHLEGQ